VKGDLVILEQTNQSLAKNNEKKVGISNYLDERLISFLEAEDQKEVLRTLVDLLDREGKLQDKDSFFQAILEREKIISTGIGIGVAIPHAKLKGYEEFFIAVGIQKNQGIDWQAIDGLPVRIIIMIGGPDNSQTEYLNILSLITSAIKDEERRKKLLKASQASDVLAIFDGV